MMDEYFLKKMIIASIELGCLSAYPDTKVIGFPKFLQLTFDLEVVLAEVSQKSNQKPNPEEFAKAAAKLAVLLPTTGEGKTADNVENGTGFRGR